LPHPVDAPPSRYSAKTNFLAHIQPTWQNALMHGNQNGWEDESRELELRKRLERESGWNEMVRRRAAHEPLEQERLEQERLEQERRDKEQLEIEKWWTETLRKRAENPAVQLERERLKRLEQPRLEQERLEQQRLEQEQLESEQLESEQLESEQLESEQLESERLEQERLEPEREYEASSSIKAATEALTIRQLREWIQTNSMEDQWLVSLDTVIQKSLFRIEEIEKALTDRAYKPWGECNRVKVVHVSEVEQENLRWTVVEYEPLERERREKAHHLRRLEEITKGHRRIIQGILIYGLIPFLIFMYFVIFTPVWLAGIVTGLWMICIAARRRIAAAIRRVAATAKGPEAPVLIGAAGIFLVIILSVARALILPPSQRPEDRKRRQSKSLRQWSHRGSQEGPKICATTRILYPTGLRKSSEPMVWWRYRILPRTRSRGARNLKIVR
jgi:hypothetical protein